MTPLELLDVLSGYTFSRNILKRLPSFVPSTSIFAKARGTTCRQKKKNKMVNFTDDFRDFEKR